LGETALLVYWCLFLYFAFGSLIEQANSTAVAASGQPNARIYSGISKGLLRFGLFLTALLIGFRFKVGADWRSYAEIFYSTRLQTFADIPRIGDPGYYLLNIVVQGLGADLWLVNLVCGIIVAIGICRFAEVQARPWLTVLVAVPYLIIVVAMGYTRQAVSIGFILMAMASYIRTTSVIRVGIYVVLAAMFHRTAIIALPFIAVGNERARFIQLLVSVVLAYLLYYLFLSNSLDRYISNYIDARYAAEGAGVRIAMDFFPAVLLFLRRSKLGFSTIEWRIWRNLALVALALPVVLVLLPSSAALDRIALYIIPLQLAVLSRPKSVFATEGVGTLLIILYLATVQFTWLNYAHHARFWVPYHLWSF
jgi:hypothetical protein